jgi:hypothetical protein
MLDKEQIQKVIREQIQIDDEGLKTTRTFSIEEICKLGVNDVGAFLNGLMDAENENDFNESSDDYVKGYRYGKTGTF